MMRTFVSLSVLSIFTLAACSGRVGQPVETQPAAQAPVKTAAPVATALEKAAGIQLNYIVFNSGGEANAALLGGSVDLAGPNPSEAAQLIQAGRLRPIAMFSPQRLEKWPDVPTAREQGYDVTLEQHRGVIAVGGLTKDQELFWQNAMAKLFQTADFKKYMSDNGLRPLLKIGDEAQKYIVEQDKFYTAILTELGIAKKR